MSYVYTFGFGRTSTEHTCPECGSQLLLVEPSNLLECSKRGCPVEPLFLV